MLGLLSRSAKQLPMKNDLKEKRALRMVVALLGAESEC
jgi:hypothetical protein